MIMWRKEKQRHLISDSGARFLGVNYVLTLFSDMQTGSFACTHTHYTYIVTQLSFASVSSSLIPIVFISGQAAR